MAIAIGESSVHPREVGSSMVAAWGGMVWLGGSKSIGKHATVDASANGIARVDGVAEFYAVAGAPTRSAETQRPSAARRAGCGVSLVISALLLLGGCSRSSTGPSGAVDETSGSDSSRGTGSAREQSSGSSGHGSATAVEAGSAARASGASEAGSGTPQTEGGSDRGIRITTNTLEPEEVPPIPEGFELLYVTGKDVPGRLEVFLVDGEMLYWAQRANLWRAPKDGSGEPVAFGHWDTTNQGSSLLADDTYIYWQDGPHIKRKRKDSSALTESRPLYPYNFPSGEAGFDSRYQQETETIDYGGSYSPALFAKDATHLYVAANACSPVHKVRLESLQVETFELDRPEYGGGNSAMTMDETHIYCGNNNYLFRFRKDASEFEVLYEEFQLVRSMVSGNDQVFVMDDPPGSAAPDILGFTKDGRVVGYGMSPEWGGSSSYGAPIQFDAERQQLYWGGTDWITTLDLRGRRFVPYQRMRFTFAFTADEDHLYWGGELDPSPGGHVVTILRLQKDRLALPE